MEGDGLIFHDHYKVSCAIEHLWLWCVDSAEFSKALREKKLFCFSVEPLVSAKLQNSSIVYPIWNLHFQVVVITVGPLIGQLCLSYWPHTHEYIGNMNWIRRVVTKRKRNKIKMGLWYIQTQVQLGRWDRVNMIKINCMCIWNSQIISKICITIME